MWREGDGRVRLLEKSFKGILWGDRNSLHCVMDGGFMDVYEYENLKICAFLYIIVCIKCIYQQKYSQMDSCMLNSYYIAGNVLAAS